MKEPVPPFDAYEGDEPFVFISYAHDDASLVYKEISRFHDAGCNIWYDEGIDASEEWPEAIAKAVIDCAVFVIFITPRSTASINCRNEVNLALNEGKPFLAIHLEETELPPGLRLRMGDLQAIFRHNIPVERYERKSLGSLYQLLGTKPTDKLIQGMFKDSLSAELLNQLVKKGNIPSLGGEEVEITAFFSDIQSCSSYSESLLPSQYVSLINEYLTSMTDVLYEACGTLDRYIQDAIVAMFGAPVPFPDHAYKAVKASLLFQKRQHELCEKWKGEGNKWPKIVSHMQTRVGCNTGRAIVGNIGPDHRFDFSMVGPTVNLAALSESRAKEFGVFCMVTDNTQKASMATNDNIAFRYLDNVRIREGQQTVKLYEAVGFKTDLSQEIQDCLDCYNQGVSKYLSLNFAAAINLFEKSKLLEPNQPNVNSGTNKNPSTVLLDRCRSLMEKPPSDNWDGVFPEL